MEKEKAKAIAFTFFGSEMVQEANMLQLNDLAAIHFNIKGRKWEKNGNVSYFTNLEAWRVESAEQNMNASAPPPQTEADIPPAPEEEDLPF